MKIWTKPEIEITDFDWKNALLASTYENGVLRDEDTATDGGRDKFF